MKKEELEQYAKELEVPFLDYHLDLENKNLIKEASKILDPSTIYKGYSFTFKEKEQTNECN